jgi:hypothetical protein
MSGPAKSALLAFACCALAWACASPGQKLVGSVRVYGSEPHTYAGILSEKDGRVYLINGGEKERELRELQGRRVEFTVRIGAASRAAYPPADGTAAVISYRIVE